MFAAFQEFLGNVLFLCMILIPNPWLFGAEWQRIKPIKMDGFLDGSEDKPWLS